MQTYLKRFYFDEAKLRDHALIEFSHALHTGRMIAVIGSMASEGLDYPDWKELIKAYLGKALMLAGSAEISSSRTATDAIGAMLPRLEGHYTIDSRVAASVAREALRHLDQARRSAGLPGLRLEKQLVEFAAKQFESRPAGQDRVIARLIDSLDIRRFATLNYDLELELALLASGDLRDAALDDGDFAIWEKFKTALDSDQVLKHAQVASNWWSKKPSGRRIESDVLDRERPDRLLEFAVQSTLIDRHIMHLHGRIDRPESMIIGLRDYDRLYRKTDVTTLPFESGSQLLFSGNPILFVGIGMTEAEINQQLQNLVSNHPYRYVTPTFLIWNSSSFLAKNTKERHELKIAKRLDWLHRLGVLVIYDEDIPEFATRLGSDAKLLDELVDVSITAAKLAGDPAARQDFAAARQTAHDKSVKLLGPTLRALGDSAVETTRRSQDEIDDWRKMSKRIEPKAPATASQPYARMLWSRRDMYAPTESGMNGDHQRVEALKQSDRARARAILAGARAQNEASPFGANIHVLFAKRGAGKGRIARSIHELDQLPAPIGCPRYRLLINAGFSFDTDSMLDALVRFVRLIRGQDWKELPQSSRETFFREVIAPSSGSPSTRPRLTNALIVINGMERFFDLDGKPLSVELDQFCRMLASADLERGRLRCVFLGTERILRYFETIAPGARIAKIPRDEETASETPWEERPLESAYLESVRQAFKRRFPSDHAVSIAARATIPPAPAGDQSSLAKNFFRYYLGSEVLAAAGIRSPLLCLALLRVLAFIGSPVEAIVLRHAPVVRDALRRLRTEEAGAFDEVDVIKKAMVDLLDLNLVVPVQSFEENSAANRGPGDPALWERYGLHKALLDDLRNRSGIGLAPAKRATAFNLSLYAAQPIEGDKPSAAVHDELGALIDTLIGAYKDDPIGADKDGTLRAPRFDPAELADAVKRATTKLPPGALRWREGSKDDAPASRLAADRLLWPETATALRAALAVIRGYFSTSSLLAVDYAQRRNADERDGALLEHAQRLDRLLRGFRKVSMLRAAIARPWRTAAVELSNVERNQRLGAIDARLGPSAFYAEELVWLYNEIGVVHLAMGDLYRAQDAFDNAHRANQRVEWNTPSHNWRRITLNQILVDIERGRLIEAERKIIMIEDTINRRPNFDGSNLAAITRVDRMTQRFGAPDEPPRSFFDQEVMHDEIFTVGLLLGYRGMCANLRGRFEDAERNYDRSANILRRIGQPRAYALFMREAAGLARAMRIHPLYQRLMADTLAVSQAGGQNDIACQARMVAAWVRFRENRDGPDRSIAGLRDLESAKEYSSQTDIYRLRVIAGTKLAKMKLALGDKETALEYATDAMIYATAFGMTLRKIVLRLLIGEIYVLRGDRKAGKGVIESAMEEANRIGFQPSTTIARLNEMV